MAGIWCLGGEWGAAREKGSGEVDETTGACRLLSKKNGDTAKEVKPGSCRLAGHFGPILPCVQKRLVAGSPVWEQGGPPRGQVASARLPPSSTHRSANEKFLLLGLRDTDISSPDAFRGPSRGRSRDGR